jgi:alpha-glucosidase (family GH31 glycosyl hydrolase)
MGLSGVAYWGTDIGGVHAVFTGEPTDDELLIRWLEFGALTGVMRTQTVELANYVPGAPGGRAQVWHEGVRPIWRRYAKLRTQLFPYIWRAAQEYRDGGLPLMRHLALAYPDDPAAYSAEAEYEYLFGPDLLVAPVIEKGASSRRLYLPPGEWVDFWQAVSYDEGSGSFERSGAATPLTGGRVIEVDAPLDRIPLFVRAGACLPLLPPEVDTLADLGDKPGLVHLSDVAGQERTLAFGDECG